jgi:hypothetical protein
LNDDFRTHLVCGYRAKTVSILEVFQRLFSGEAPRTRHDNYPLVPLREAEIETYFKGYIKMMRTYLYTPHTVTVDDVCNAFKINVDVRFVVCNTYRKFIIYHMVSYNTRRIYERLGIELYKTLPMPAFMMVGILPDTNEDKSDFKRITFPVKRTDFTFDHKYFQ